MTRTLTLATIKKAGACSAQVALFRKMFGKSVFSWSWAADSLLTAAAWAEYARVTAAAWARAYISDGDVK